MKRFFVVVLIVLPGALGATITPERALDNRGEICFFAGSGRSLDDILKQNGGQLEPGRCVVTADGVLKDESEESLQFAKVQKKITRFILGADENFGLKVEELRAVTAASDDISTAIKLAQELFMYVKKYYADEKVPLLRFAYELYSELALVSEMRGDILGLAGSEMHRSEVKTLLARVQHFQTNLERIESAFHSIVKNAEDLLDIVVSCDCTTPEIADFGKTLDME